MNVWTSDIFRRIQSTDVRKIKRARRTVCKRLRQLAIADDSLGSYITWRANVEAASPKNIRREARINAWHESNA